MHFTCQTDHAHTPSVMFLAAAVFLFFMSGSMAPFVYAEQIESHSGFSSELETPPTLITPGGTADEQPDCTVPANARVHSMTCSASAQQDQTRSASAQSGYLDNADIHYTPRLGNINRKMDKVISGSQKDEVVENEWNMGFEFRGSPVKEEHGDAERHDSIGGLIKGNLRF